MFQIAETRDGTPTVINTLLNQSYHSMHGALMESMHVFIGEGLQYFTSKFQHSVIRIFEMGFGTGLNALLTYQYAKAHGLKIHYQAVEKHPLPVDLVLNLKLPQYLDVSETLITQFHHSQHFPNAVRIDDDFLIAVGHLDMQEARLSPGSIDLMYFDAFSPSVQPELWSEDIMRTCFQALSVPGVWVTYSSKGDVRRALIKAGFQVEKIPGPPGKREMLRALKI